jgi:endo-1,4-beta-xylanase
MKLLKSGLFLALLACTGILITGCPPEPNDKKEKGISLNKPALLLTVYGKEKLTYTISGGASNNVTWRSDPSSVATVDSDGTVKAVSTTEGATCVITVKTDDGYWAQTTVTITLSGQVDMMTLPPMKDQFKVEDYFMIGNIANSAGDITGTGAKSNMLKRHFNVVTAENSMKPDSYGGSRSGSTVSNLSFSTSNSFVNAAKNAGFTVHGHVLLWHRQNPTWITNIATDKTTALDAMKSYITQVMDNFKGKVYSWDILNEAFPDGIGASANWKTSIRTTGDSQAANPWFVALGSDFVYEGFKAARLTDPGAILYYNDYNLNDEGKSTVVAKMVKDVNDQWKGDNENTDKSRPLIEGIGMQSHHNTTVSATAIKASLDRFKNVGIKIISISELDVLCRSYDGALEGSNKPAHSTLTDKGKTDAADLYGDYFKLFIQYKDIIERVTFWGMFDRASWRSGGLPLPFEGTPATTSPTVIRAKPAYYKIMGALE